MQENGDFFAIFSLEDAPEPLLFRGGRYPNSIRDNEQRKAGIFSRAESQSAPQNATSVIGGPAEFRGEEILGDPPPSTRPTTGIHLLSDVATRGCRRFLQTIRVQQAGRNE